MKARLLVLALGVIAAPLPAQAANRAEVVWHWFDDCSGSDSLTLDVTLDSTSLLSSTFPICRNRRDQIRPEPEQRILVFEFTAEPQRFKRSYASAAPETQVLWS